MSVKAIIDVGTNSVKLLVASCADGVSSVLCDLVEVVRLGEGTAASGRLTEEAMSRALGAVCGMVQRARALGAEGIAAVGTQAMREAENAADFIGRVRDACGVEIRLISGEEEAELSFGAAISAFGDLPEKAVVCVFDVGGGSSEIIVGRGSGIRSRLSLPVGALALHGEFFKGLELVDGKTLTDARTRIRGLLTESPAPRLGGRDLVCVGVGGTITTLASVMLALDPYDPGAIAGARLSVFEAERQIALYASTPLAERASIRGLNPKRADIILAGACIACELLLFTGAGYLTVSDRGLRYGALEKIPGPLSL